MADALSALFPNAVDLRCFLHFKENIERKLRDTATVVANEVLGDIVGKPFQYQLGLVDAKDATHLHTWMKCCSTLRENEQAKWFTLNDEQRQRRVDKFMKAEIEK